MKYVSIISRILLGLVFVIFGLNGFLNFIQPPPMEGAAAEFMTAIYGSGYLHVVKVIEIIGGLLLLSGRFTPAGLFLLGPVVVNILLFHAFLDPQGLPVAIVITLLEAFLVVQNWDHFSAIFTTVK